MNSIWHREVTKSHFRVIKSVPLWANQSDLLLICVWWPSAFIWYFSSTRAAQSSGRPGPQGGSRILWLQQHWLTQDGFWPSPAACHPSIQLCAPRSRGSVWAVLGGSRGVRGEEVGHLPSSLKGCSVNSRIHWKTLGCCSMLAHKHWGFRASPPDAESWLCSVGPLMFLFFEPKIISEII